MCVSALPCHSEVFVDGKLGERLLALRKASGMTQEQLAEKVFVTRQAVSKWERGESVPDLELLVALAEMYGVSLDELVLGTRADEPEPAGLEAEREEFLKTRKKRVFLKAVSTFVLAVGVWGLILGIVHSAALAAAPDIWIAWFTLPVVPPLVVLAAFFHYIPKEWRAYFFLVPFVSGLLYLLLHYAAHTDAAWLAFMLIPLYYIPAVVYTVVSLRAKKRCPAPRPETSAANDKTEG